MRQLRKIALAVSDLLLVESSYLIALFFVHENGHVINDFFVYKAVLIGIIYIAVFYMFKLYESLWSYASVDEFLCVVAANLVSGAILEIIIFRMAMWQGIKVNLVGMVLAMIFTIGNRVCFRIYRRGLKYISFKKPNGKERVMIVGGGSAATMVIKEMTMSDKSRYLPVAIIDDDRRKLEMSIQGVKIKGTRDDIERVAKEDDIDSIIIAMPSVDNSVKADIIKKCKKTGCRLKIIPGIYELLDEDTMTDKIRDVSVEDLLGRDTIKLDNEGIEGYIKGKTILVTGGGGSIGSELCRQIARFNPKTLIIFDIYENNAYDIQQELRGSFKNLDLQVLIGSIRDRRRLEDVFRKYKPDIVFHAAAHKHVPLMEDSPGEAIKNNVFGTLNLAETADKYGVKKFVMISTDKAVNPTNVMGATKRTCEMIVQAMNEKSETEFVAVRFGNVLGSNGSVIPLFKKQIAKGGPVTVTHKDIIRYFMLIPEAAQLVLQAGAYAKGGEIFVLDMGKPVKIYDLAEDLIRLSGFTPGVDMDIKITGLRPGEKLYEELLMSEEGLAKTGHEKIFVGKPTFKDINKLKKELNELKFVVETGKKENIVEKLRQVVPTFKTPEEVNRKAVLEAEEADKEVAATRQ